MLSSVLSPFLVVHLLVLQPRSVAFAARLKEDEADHHGASSSSNESDSFVSFGDERGEDHQSTPSFASPREGRTGAEDCVAGEHETSAAAATSRRRSAANLARVAVGRTALACRALQDSTRNLSISPELQERTLRNFAPSRDDLLSNETVWGDGDYDPHGVIIHGKGRSPDKGENSVHARLVRLGHATAVLLQRLSLKQTILASESRMTVHFDLGYLNSYVDMSADGFLPLVFGEFSENLKEVYAAGAHVLSFAQTHAGADFREELARLFDAADLPPGSQRESLLVDALVRVVLDPPRALKKKAVQIEMRHTLTRWQILTEERDPNVARHMRGNGIFRNPGLLAFLEEKEGEEAFFGTDAAADSEFEFEKTAAVAAGVARHAYGHSLLALVYKLVQAAVLQLGSELRGRSIKQDLVVAGDAESIPTDKSERTQSQEPKSSCSPSTSGDVTSPRSSALALHLDLLSSLLEGKVRGHLFADVLVRVQHAGSYEAASRRVHAAKFLARQESTSITLKNSSREEQELPPGQGRHARDAKKLAKKETKKEGKKGSQLLAQRRNAAECGMAGEIVQNKAARLRNMQVLDEMVEAT